MITIDKTKAATYSHPDLQRVNPNTESIPSQNISDTRFTTPMNSTARLRNISIHRAHFPSQLALATTDEASLLEEKRILFKPYVHPTPNVSIVYVKKHGSKTDLIPINIEYNSDLIPDPKVTKRKDIQLEGIDQETVDKARLIAQAIKEESELATKLYKEYKRYLAKYNSFLATLPKTSSSRYSDKTEEVKEKQRKRNLAMKRKTRLDQLTMPPNSSRIRPGIFDKVFEKKVMSLANSNAIREEEEDKDNIELQALTAYFCLQQNGGCLTMFPDGYLNDSDEHLIEKARALTKYCLVNLNGENTAEAVERIQSWKDMLVKAGLTPLYFLFSPDNLLKATFPGYLDGPHPPIREWLLPLGIKWQDNKGLLTRACKERFSSQRGVIKDDGEVNYKVVLETDWSSIFNDPQEGIRGAFVSDLQGILSALRLAIPGLIGIKESEGQIPPWRFTRLFILQGTNALKYLDLITRYIVEEKLKLFDNNGNVSAAKIKNVRDWHDQYDQEKKCSLHVVGLNAEAALKRVYPHLFGWGNDQIKPGELNIRDKWKGTNGKRLFQLRFAHSIYAAFEALKEANVEQFVDHKVRFNLVKDEPLYLLRNEFVKLRDYYIEQNKSWFDHYIEHNLLSGFLTVAKNQKNAFEILLGKLDERTSSFGRSNITLEDVKERIPSKATIANALLSPIDSPYEISDSDIHGAGRQQDDPNSTGIQGTCLEFLTAHRPPTQVMTQTVALYEALAAAVLSSPTDTSGIPTERDSVIEALLINRYTSGQKKGELILSDFNLGILLKTFRDTIIDETKMVDELKLQLKFMITNILTCNRSATTPREILTYATENNNKNIGKVNFLDLLNYVIESTISTIAIHEFRYSENHGRYSAHYERAFGNLEIASEAW